MNETMANEGQQDFWSKIDALCDETGGPFLRLALFDPQSLAPLDWLVNQSGVPQEYLLELVEKRVLPQRKLEDGGLGFTIFTEAQLRFMSELRTLHPYSDAEIEHIIRFQNDLIEYCYLEITPYDDRNLSDYQHFLRRIQQEFDEIVEEEKALRDPDRPSFLPAEQINQRLETLARDRAGLENIIRFYRKRTEQELTKHQRNSYRKILFRLQWRDEWVRTLSVNQFEAQIRQGYSPEFQFCRYSSDQNGAYEFGPPDWETTLSGYQDSRAKGKRFPLRTPDFSLSEEGLLLRSGLTPDRYSELFERYELPELFSRVAALGDNLWNPPQLADGFDKCPGCDTIFESRNSRRRYCSKGCRESAKHRRWRERDPERVREANARYYARHYSDVFGSDES